MPTFVRYGASSRLLELRRQELPSDKVRRQNCGIVVDRKLIQLVKLTSAPFRSVRCRSERAGKGTEYAFVIYLVYGIFTYRKGR